MRPLAIDYTYHSCFSEPLAVPADPHQSHLCEGHMPLDVLSVAVPTAAPPSTTTSEPPSFDERWAAWQAKGAAHERAVRRKMAFALPVLVVIAAIVIYLLFRR